MYNLHNNSQDVVNLLFSNDFHQEISINILNSLFYSRAQPFSLSGISYKFDL